MSSSPPHRPRGFVRRTASLLAPTAMTAGRVATERDPDARRQRLAAAARDKLRERRRPTRLRMRALSAQPGGRLVWRAVPEPPAPGPDGALVHPVAVATCDLDRPLALGATPFPLPLHFGHECVADVVSVGSEVTSVKPGQRVVVPFQISCGRCPACRAGLTGNCTSVPPISMYGFGLAGGHWGGALSDLLAVPFADGMLVPLPAGIDAAAAASVADNVSDGHRHVAPHLAALLAREPDAEVLIVGAVKPNSLFSASVPLYAGLIARALGARRVTFADSRPAIRREADALGLTAITPRELRGRCPAPLVIDAGTTPRSLRAALTATAPDGICSCVGSLHRSSRIPTALMYGRNATLHVGRSHARPVIPAVLALMTEGRLAPERVTTRVAGFDEAPAVLTEHVRGNATKTILVDGG